MMRTSQMSRRTKKLDKLEKKLDKVDMDEPKHQEDTAPSEDKEHEELMEKL